MKTLFHIGIWLAVLVIGVWIVGFVFRSTCQGGTGNGAGFFDYSFSCDLFPDVEGDPSIAYMELEGHAPRRFKFYGGVSPVYDAITMNWRLNAGYEGRPEGRIVFNLASGTLNSGGDSLSIDSNHILEVVGIQDRPANRSTIKYLLDVLEDCHTGELPRPSHFSHSPKEPMLGRIQHAAHGFGVNYSTLTWVGIWGGAATIFYARKRITSRGRPPPTSRLVSMISRNSNPNPSSDARSRW